MSFRQMFPIPWIILYIKWIVAYLAHQPSELEDLEEMEIVQFKLT